MFSTLSLRGYPQSNNRHPPRNSCPQHTHTKRLLDTFTSSSSPVSLLSWETKFYFLFFIFFLNGYVFLLRVLQFSFIYAAVQRSSSFFFVDIVVRLVTEREREREKDKLFVEPHTLTAYFCAVCCRH